MKKKILSIILSIVLLAGMIISPLPAEAFDFSQEVGYSKLSFTPQPLSESSDRYPYMDSANINCAIQSGQVVVSEGYTNLLTYTAPSDGHVRLGFTSWGSTFTLTIANGDLTGRVAEFSVTDADGNILYPTDGKVAVLDENSPTHTVPANQLIPVSGGEPIYFVIHSVSGKQNSFTPQNIVHFLPESGDSVQLMNWQYWPMDAVMENFTFSYATDYAKVTDAGLDMSTGYQKKLNFTKELMVAANDGGYYTLIAPNQQYVCGSQYYGYGAAIGYANIVTFKSPEDGTFRLNNMTLSLTNYESKSLDFAITDKNGRILYPTDQSVLTIGGEVQSQSSISFKHNVKAGDEINFVCFNPNGTVGGIAMTAEIYVNGVSYCSGNVWPGSNTAIWPEGRETTDVLTNTDKYYQYYYSTDVTVENLVKAPWSEFVSLDKYESAPNTIETWVKISDNVADDKRGIIVSNGGVTGYNDDLTIAMDYNGQPRIYSASQAFDFTVNADLRTGEWTHLAFVNDQANNKMYCYLNGVLKGVCNDSYDNTKYGTRYSYVIGNNNYYDQGSAFQGEMRDLRFWSDARSASEISDNQNAALKGNEEGLLGTWALNDYSSTVTYFADRTEAANHGQLVSPYDKFVQTDAVTDYDYTMAVIGDTQYYVESETNVERFYDITEYLAGLSEKPAYVMQVGDITSDNGDDHYTKAQTAMNSLATAGIPHSIALGNHDYPSAGKTIRDSSMFNKYFDQAYFETLGNMEFYPEYYEVSTSTEYTKTVVADDAETVADGEIKLSEVVTRSCESQDIQVGDIVSLKTDNNYRLFTAGNTQYMLVTLEFNPRDAVIEWANQVVAAHSDYKVIVLTHGYTDNGEIIDSSSYFLGADGATKDSDQNEPNVLWDEFVSKHENIFMLFCGHSHAPDITANVMVGDNGNTVYQYMVAPTMGNGGDGVFLMMYFNETNGTVDFRYYSPTEDKYWGYQNMLQIDLDNSNTNTDIVEVTKPNIATGNLLQSFAGGDLNGAGYWLVEENTTTSDFYKARFVKDGTVFVNETSSVVRQYKVSADGTAKILAHLDYVRINGGAVDSNNKASIDIQIYNNLGENITSQFKTGASAKSAVAGTGTQYVPYSNETFNMVSNGSQTGWIYGEIEGMKAGETFYFVCTAHDMSSVENTVTQKQEIYISSNVAHANAEKVTVTDVDGEWVSCVNDFPTTSVVTDNASRQGHLGWYYKYVSNSVLRNYSYSVKKAEVNVNIVGDGSISTYTTSATYDATTGKITLPHDNSLFVNVKKADNSVLSAVYWNDIPVAHTTSTDASIRVNVPCVENGGTLTVIFKPITESVTINGVSCYFDYGMQELGDVNGTDGIDVRDLVRTVSHLEDSTVAIKVYNTDINKDEKIDKNDTSELRNILLQ